MSGKSFKAHGCSFVVVAAQMRMQNVVEKLYREVVLV
jgi:hypothetical protein